LLCPNNSGVYSLTDFTGVEVDSGRLFFIPSQQCYNAGEEFIEEALDVLVESIEKQLDNYKSMEELFLRYCNSSQDSKIGGIKEMITNANTNNSNNN
jgi:hypothetical protein